MNQVTICQTDLILTHNCVIVSKWVHNLIWQAYYKLLKICFFYTFCIANEKQAKFDVPLQPPRFTIYPLMIFLFEKFLTDKTYLGYNLSIYNITYLNTTKTFYVIYSKNLPGKLYAKTVPGFWTLNLLTPLEICFFIF